MEEKATLGNARLRSARRGFEGNERRKKKDFEIDSSEALDPVSDGGAPISTFLRRNLRHNRNTTDFLVQLLAAARNEVS